jgi:acetate kinase
MAMEDLILVLNSGSSSIKFSAFNAMDEQDPTLLFKRQVDGIGLAPYQSLTCMITAHSRPTFAHLAPS